MCQSVKRSCSFIRCVILVVLTYFPMHTFLLPLVLTHDLTYLSRAYCEIFSLFFHSSFPFIKYRFVWFFLIQLHLKTVSIRHLTYFKRSHIFLCFSCSSVSISAANFTVSNPLHPHSCGEYSGIFQYCFSTSAQAHQPICHTTKAVY